MDVGRVCIESRVYWPRSSSSVAWWPWLLCMPPGSSGGFGGFGPGGGVPPPPEPPAAAFYLTARDLGLSEVDYRVWRQTVPAAELTDVRTEAVPVPLEGQFQ